MPDGGYGRYSSLSAMPLINAKLSWIIMEVPSLILSSYCFLVLGDTAHFQSPANWILFLLFTVHYFHRAVIYPLRTKSKPLPILIPISSLFFTAFNGYLQGRALGHYAPAYPKEYLFDVRFLVGVILFIAGFGINYHSDAVLRNLRKPGETLEYKIPYGGAFNFVTAANYFGEIVEWGGFALACWTVNAFAFFLFTTLYLSARARHHHIWYLKKFDNYPKNRKIVIPLIY